MSNELSIRLFATLKDRAGQPRVSITLDEPTAVNVFLEQLAAKYPKLATTLPSSLVAVNRTYAERTTIINPGDEVALFPPVSGG
ncbi:MAG: molybdopterin converting factor subunit 1 [Candidatus Promineifilaceae bacterium]